MGKLIFPNISYEKIKEIINVFELTMQDYLYCLDWENDKFYISPLAMEQFDIPSAEFNNASQEFAKLIHEEDYDMLMENLGRMKDGEFDFHDLKYRWMTRSRTARWINCKGQNIYTDDGKPKYIVGCINDIAKLPLASNISGLILERELLNILAEVDKNSLRGYLVRIGIDDFREICENKGTEYGWKIVKSLSDIIHSYLKKKDVCYATGRDELMVNLYSAETVDECIEFCQKIREKVHRLIKESEYEIYFTASAGILPVGIMKDKNIYDTLKFSSFTLSEARKKGLDEIYVYNEGAYEKFIRNRELSSYMRNAVVNSYKGFKLLYQPIVDSESRKVVGGEALLRFDTPESGLVMPFEMIPILEYNALIVPVGRWVLKQALTLCKQIRKTIPNFKISVNISYVQIQKSDILDDILGILADYEMPSNSIIIEITESGNVDFSNKARAFCEGLKTYGIPVAIDDFGTGYSNFSYLMDIEPHSLKIDRSFTLKALKNEKDYSLLRHMAEMIHSVDSKYVIEGIETEDELSKISGVNPDYIQGYLFGRPLEKEDFLKLI